MLVPACLALFPGNCGDIVRLISPIYAKVKDVAQATMSRMKVKRGMGVVNQVR